MPTLSEITQRYIEALDKAAIKEVAMDDELKLTEWQTQYLASRANAVLPSRRLGKSTSVAAYQKYCLDKASQTDECGGPLSAADINAVDEPSNVHVSEVAYWPDLDPELKLYPMPTPLERTVFSWSVPHDRITFNAEYLGQPDGSLRQVPEILVTPEMRMNGGSVLRGGRAGTGRLNPEDDAQAIYGAMHAVAPVPLVSEAEDRIAAMEQEISDLRRTRRALFDLKEQYRCEVVDLKSSLATEQPTDIDYHGPLGKPDEKGRRVPIADPPHEQFHRAVGDVLAGKIMPKAREQMAEALRRSPPDAPTTASTSKPMPDKALGTYDDPRRLGLA